MDAGYGAPPATSPPQVQRRPFDMTRLPPEMQQRLMSGETIAFEDGSTLYPDGTASGAGDSPNDFAPGGGYDMGAGGYNSSPQLLGPQALASGGAPPATSPFMDAQSGAMQPQFERYFAAANAGMPGQPAPAEGLAASNPMGDPIGDAADQRAPVHLTVEGPRVGTYGAGPSQAAKARAPYGGRVGRRMMPTRR
jgi:hypothetical protein